MINDDDCPYDDFGCVKFEKTVEMDEPCDNPFIDSRGYAPLEIDLIDLSYRYTVGDRTMAYEIGQGIYEYFKNLAPGIDKWYEKIKK